jgi:hypothetical protein
VWRKDVQIMRLRTQKLRSGLLLAVIAALPICSRAAKRVTVAQFTQTLAADVGAHKPDAEIARRIGGMELSERLTEATLAKLAVTLNADPQAALALQLLADQSAFLDPPASELPPTPAPDDPTQQRALDAARTYVAQTLPRLPNLLATETTNRYDDSPLEAKGGWPVRAGLHLVNTSSREVSVYEETASRSAAVTSARWQEQAGLSSGGEFASTLGMILTDTLKGKVTWSHWEQTATGRVAVFHYSVPRSASHFEVIGSLPRQAALEGSPAQTGNSRVSGIGVRPSANSPNSSTFLTTPGYHGSLWLDPATGSILRVTVEVDAKEGVPFQRAAILVQYGLVQIGDSEFICPVRGVALTVALSGANLDPLTRLPGDAPTQWLNESVFTGYRRFGSTVRVVPGAQMPQ